MCIYVYTRKKYPNCVKKKERERKARACIHNEREKGGEREREREKGRERERERKRERVRKRECVCGRARCHLESRREGNQNKDIFASLCIRVCARACVHKEFVHKEFVGQSTVTTVTTVRNVHLCVHLHVRVGSFQVICVSKETQ